VVAFRANGERREKKMSPILIGSIDDPRIIAKKKRLGSEFIEPIEMLLHRIYAS
jgi:hypothetical protein